MDLSNRDEYEQRLARALSRVYGRHRREIVELLGDPPDPVRLDVEFWNRSSEELQAVVRPILEKVALESAEQLARESVIGVDWGLVNQSAADWASRYTFDQVSGITRTSQRAIQRAISRYFAQGQTIGELYDSLSRIFGPVRAEMIAVTEITRAAARGEVLIADDIARQGVVMVRVWQTNRDELVCPICGPLQGQQAENGIFTHPDGSTYTEPPAHVRCRCWLNHALPEPVNG